MRIGMNGRRMRAAAGLVAGGALLLSAAPASAAINTFTSSSVTTINDASGSCTADGLASPYPAQNHVDSLTGTITDLDVTLRGLSHTWPADLRVVLESPTGVKVLLLHENGANHDVSGIDITFDDAATQAPPTNGGALAAGSYKPSNQTNGVSGCAINASTSLPAPAPAGPYGSTMSAFNGSAPNGTWKLYVLDQSVHDTGSISGWTLRVTDGGPPVAANDAYTHFGNDTPLRVAAPGVLANDTDPDNDSLTARLVSAPANAESFQLNPDGSFDYQPRDGFHGNDSFTYRAFDGQSESNTATVALRVDPGCGGRRATIVGTSGSDDITGTPDDDVIVAGAGDDDISSGAGADKVCGEAGQDDISAGADNDYGHGGAGSGDRVSGGDDDDLVIGGSGSSDTCAGGSGTDRAHSSCERVSGVP